MSTSLEMVNGPDISRPNWHSLKSVWPNSEASHFVRVSGLIWHFIEMNSQSAMPKILLIHGTGASAHSFRGCLPLLAQSYHVLAIDLPGHGFTNTPSSHKLSLTSMTQLIAQLLKALNFQPDILLGHSAGAAIAISLVQDGYTHSKTIIGYNSALKPYPSSAVFSPLAKLLFINPLTSHFFSLQARHSKAAQRMLSYTNSKIDKQGEEQYRTLMECTAHVNGALGMMSHWNLEPLQEKLPQLKAHLHLVTASDDTMISPSVSIQSAHYTPSASISEYKKGGHLLHEVYPDTVPIEVEQAFQKQSQDLTL